MNFIFGMVLKKLLFYSQYLVFDKIRIFHTKLFYYFLFLVGNMVDLFGRSYHEEFHPPRVPGIDDISGEMIHMKALWSVLSL